MHLRGMMGASNAREGIWRRAAVLTAVVGVCAAGLMFALTGGSARADSGCSACRYGQPAGISDVSDGASFSAVLKRFDVKLTCDDGSYYPANSSSSSGQIPPSPCSLRAKVTVGGWTAHFLKLRSRTLASGKLHGPVSDAANPENDEFVLRDVLPRSLVRKLRSATLKGLRVDGVSLTYSGTATYPVNVDANGNPVPVTYKTETFSFTDTFDTPYMNSCWMPLNQAFQVGFADPHGKLCPGY